MSPPEPERTVPGRVLLDHGDVEASPRELASCGRAENAGADDDDPGHCSFGVTRSPSTSGR